MQRKKVARFKRDIELSRHQNSYSKYTRPEQLVRKRIRNLNRSVNKQLIELKKYSQVRSFSKELLFERLHDYNMVNKTTGTLKVNLPTNLKEMDYKVIEEAIKRFKSSPSSSGKGIRNIIKNQRANLLESTGDKEFVNSLSDRDIMYFNKMYSDNSFEILSRVLSSDIIKTMAENAARFNYDKDQFQVYMEMFIQKTPDVELKTAINNIYNRYVSRLQK